VTAPAVVFRANASHALGIGHVARMSALIEEAAASGVEPIALFGGDPTLAGWSRSQGIAADLRPWTTADVLAIASEPRVGAVVLDGPALAAALAPALAARGIRTIVVDDRGDFALPAHAVVNHNFHATWHAGGYPNAALHLLGRDYLMLRRAIRAVPRGACRSASSGRLRVLVNFGGSDPVGATARVVRLFPAERPVELVAVAGPGFCDRDGLHAAASIASAAGHAVEVIADPAHPGELFRTTNAAITAAGDTLGELAYLGCPSLAYAIAADQLTPARALAQAGQIAGGFPWARVDDAALRAQLAAFIADDRARRALRDRALATADGDGARRVVARLLDRAAVRADAS
jgi:UDP-2,4-diacetamido-2,4,6-trideoxy-beta-L-altropyranose hydrolase